MLLAEIDWQTGLITTVIGGVAALILASLTGFRTVVVAFFERWVENIKKRKYAHGLAALAEFYSSFDDLCNLQTVQRYMLLEGKDSGGLPQPGRPYTIRCLRGGTKAEGKDNPFKLYNVDITIDANYTNMLRQLVDSGSVLLKLSEMQKDTLLYGFYDAEGVSQSYVAYVGIVEARLIYVSLSKYQGEFSKADLIALNLGVAKLRSKLDK